MKPLLLALTLALALPTTVIAQELRFGPSTPAAGGAGRELDSVAAVVDDDVITRAELDQAVQTALGQLRARGGQLPPMDVIRKQVLERQILLKLQERAAARNGISVDDLTLNAAIATVAQRNGVSVDELRRRVERDGFSFARYREEIRRELVSSRLRQKVVDPSITVSDQEVDLALGIAPGAGPGAAAAPAREYRLAHILVGLPEGADAAQIEAAQAKADALVAELRKGADFARLATSVSDAGDALNGGEIGWRSAAQLPPAFAEAIGSMSAGQVTAPLRGTSGFEIVRVIEVRNAGEAAPGQIVQTEVRHILLRAAPGESDDAVRQRALRLRAGLNDAGFAAAARAQSQDPGSAPKGGELGWVSPGQLVPEFERAMAALKPGEISQPVKTSFGWHLIEVKNRRQVAGKVEDARRMQAREAIYKRKIEEEWDIWLRRLRDEAYVDIRL
ncbi:peptidylprolyl isomerase [Plasticicumulans sp.]|uniref:peptidylprolyl isomerase n=1 Tax=Plasticicumulans sp. TaxID=2307179 RepID=UPI0039372E8A